MKTWPNKIIDWFDSPAYKDMIKRQKEEAKANATPRMWSKDELDALIDEKIANIHIRVGEI